jgi:MFS family permease
MLQGMCVGCYLTMAPLIIRELAPTEMAGLIGSINQIFVISGIFFACLFQYLLSSIFDDPTCHEIWPYVFAVPSCTALIQTINLLYVFPYETPKYHITNRQKDKAR